MENLDYNEAIDFYTRILNLAIKISQLGSNRSSTGLEMTWTCVLHTRICVIGSSIQKLAPEVHDEKKIIPEWDYASMFALTRNIMECYQTLFYLCVEKISDDERLARKKLFDIHDYYSRVKTFSHIEKDMQEKEVIETLIEQLSTTEYFQNLDDKKQKYFLKGENAFFISRESIEEKIGNDKAYFKFLYKLLSSTTHSYPMGFYGMMEGKRGTGMPTPLEVNYSAFALNLSEQYIAASSNDMIKLLPDIINKLSEDEKNLLNSYGS